MANGNAVDDTIELDGVLVYDNQIVGDDAGADRPHDGQRQRRRRVRRRGRIEKQFGAEELFLNHAS